MNTIAEFINNNIAIELNETINYSVMQCGAEMDMNVEEMCDELFSIIDYNDVSEFNIFYENQGKQRATLISFKYYEKKIEIGEHFGSQRDYFWVRISPIDG